VANGRFGTIGLFAGVTPITGTLEKRIDIHPEKAERSVSGERECVFFVFFETVDGKVRQMVEKGTRKHEIFTGVIMFIRTKNIVKRRKTEQMRQE